MNISASEYSNGCTSGWTMYLDPFPGSADQCNRSMPFNNYYSQSKGAYQNEVEEDEDLSMLSDASSGPPNVYRDEDYSCEDTKYANNFSVSEPKKGNKHKRKEKQQRKKQQNQNFHLDDTASSSGLSFSKVSDHMNFFENNAVNNDYDYSIGHDSCLSQGFSATHFKDKSVLSKHFGFFNPSSTRKS